jgi:ATP-binding cassette, subfamily B, multidrug efflux pump
MSQDYLTREDDLGKVYDSRIMNRLYRYARPYTGWLLLALLLAAFMSGTHILLPYLSKIGIDSYIVISGKMLDLSMYSSDEQNDIIERYRGRLHAVSNTGFVIREGIMEPSDRARFDRDGALRKGTYYLLDMARYDQETGEMLQNRIHEGLLPATATLEPGHYTIRSEDLYLLDTDIRTRIRRPDLLSIRNIALVYVGILIVALGVMFSQVYLMAWIGQKIMFDIRMELFEHIQRLPIRFFNNQPVGRLVTRVSNDVNVLNEVFTSILVEMLKNLLMLAGIIVIMLKLAPNLALVTFCILPPMIAVTWVFKKKMREAYRLVRKKIALINATISEHISGIKVIQVFARERTHFNKFKDINDQAYKANMKELITHSLFSPFVVFLENLGIALILYYGGGQVVRNTITLGTLVAFLSYLSMFFGPVRDIAEKFNILQAAMASSERIFQLMDIKDEQDEDRGTELIGDGELKGDIEFKNVWFAYNDREWVLKDVSFSVKGGETVAFVGATGSGKTTIINLLTRFYRIQKGEILIDGRRLELYEKGFIRKNMAMVLQDVFLFSGDIRSNIRLNNHDVTDEKIYHVARQVNANRFVERLIGGYGHVIKEGGATLSQGQRQLLAFARALAINPALLILDEATANIDSETEQWIQKGLDYLLHNRTALVVAHRLSTIKKADKIIVIHHGRICETGTHKTLLAKRGIYYKLYQLQFKKQEKFTA